MQIDPTFSSTNATHPHTKYEAFRGLDRESFYRSFIAFPSSVEFCWNYDSENLNEGRNRCVNTLDERTKFEPVSSNNKKHL